MNDSNPKSLRIYDEDYSAFKALTKEYDCTQAELFKQIICNYKDNSLNQRLEDENKKLYHENIKLELNITEKDEIIAKLDKKNYFCGEKIDELISRLYSCMRENEKLKIDLQLKDLGG